MKLFLFPFCSFNRCLLSSLHRWECEKLSFEIWTQTKNFPLSHCSRCKDFMNKIFYDIRDKITYIPVSLGVNSLSAQTCVSMSLDCLPVLKIIWADKTGEDSRGKHLRQWFVHRLLPWLRQLCLALFFFFFPFTVFFVSACWRCILQKGEHFCYFYLWISWTACTLVQKTHLRAWHRLWSQDNKAPFPQFRFQATSTLNSVMLH